MGAFLQSSAPFGVPSLLFVCGGAQERGNQPHPGELTLLWGWWASQSVPTWAPTPQGREAGDLTAGAGAWDGLDKVPWRERTGLGVEPGDWPPSSASCAHVTLGGFMIVALVSWSV